MMTHQHIARTRDALAFLAHVHRDDKAALRAIEAVRAMTEHMAETLARHMPAEPPKEAA